MINPFNTKQTSTVSDETLVARAQKSDRRALEQLIRRHQPWIYNIALRMVYSPQDAEDVTQEVLLKIITNLANFRGESQFRTWAYRIVANYVIRMKKRRAELGFINSTASFSVLSNNVLDPNAIPLDLPMLYEEVKIHCMMGMLLCLDRRKRLVYILGEMFGVTDATGAAIMDISRDSFRQTLSRARRRMYDFLHVRCGHLNPATACHCFKLAQAMIQGKTIDPERLEFNRDFVHRIKDICLKKDQKLRNLLDRKAQELFISQPFLKPPDNTVTTIRTLLDNSDMKDIFDF